MTGRPVLYVLAGVNGAGKSSIGGHLLECAGATWFDPDAFACAWIEATGCSQVEANTLAWREGVRRLDESLAQRRSYAFETTLGGRTIPARIRQACRTHDVLMWFCGLASSELHIARVRERVAAGGHDIPEDKIRERWTPSIENLIVLMPHLAHLQVYDNSATTARGKPIPDPVRVLEMRGGKRVWPKSVKQLRATPEWAKPLLEAALALDR